MKEKLKELKKVLIWEGACEVLGRNPKELPDVSNITDEAERKYILACAKLPVHIKAMNKIVDPEFKADFGNWDVKKHYPWPEQVEDNTQPSGFGLSLRVVGYARTDTYVGARFAYCSEELGEFGFNELKQLYIDMQLEF